MSGIFCVTVCQCCPTYNKNPDQEILKILAGNRVPKVSSICDLQRLGDRNVLAYSEYRNSSFFYIKSRKVYMELSVQAGQKDEDEAHVIANWTVIPTAAREHKL